MFIAKTVALNKCPVILTKYVACLVSSTQRVFSFSYQCPGLFYTETVFISYLSLIVFIFSTFAIMRVLSALLSSLPNKSVTLIFNFFSFIYVMSTLGASRKTAFRYTGPTISKILYYLLLSSIEKLSFLLYCKYGNCE